MFFDFLGEDSESSGSLGSSGSSPRSPSECSSRGRVCTALNEDFLGFCVLPLRVACGVLQGLDDERTLVVDDFFLFGIAEPELAFLLGAILKGFAELTFRGS